MKKSRWYADREIERLGGPSAEALEFVVKNMDEYMLLMLSAASGSVDVADKITERWNHPAYSDYELVLTFRKA